MLKIKRGSVLIIRFGVIAQLENRLMDTVILTVFGSFKKL